MRRPRLSAPLASALPPAADDNQPNDGEAGEGDNVHQDIEVVAGGSGDDRLVGSSAANDIQGGPGDDVIDGGAGADSIAGGPGIDTVDNRTAPAPST